MQLIPVKTEEQIKTAANLAQLIWSEHYADILSAEQIVYMVEKFQSAQAIKNQLANQNYQYYLLTEGNNIIGYTAVQPDENALFLSKLYIKKEERGKKYASQTIRYFEEQCRQNGWSTLWLTVNKYNTNSIAAYQALGFHTVKSQVADIGNGFVMDDYIMEKAVNS